MRLCGDELLARFCDTAYAYRFGPPQHDVVVATWFDETGRELSFELPPVDRAFYSISEGIIIRRNESGDVAIADDDGAVGHVRPRAPRRLILRHPSYEVPRMTDGEGLARGSVRGRAPRATPDSARRRPPGMLAGHCRGSPRQWGMG